MTSAVYDKRGNIAAITDDKGTISSKYDALNRVTEYTDYNGGTVKCAYYELGNLIALTYSGGEIVRYIYYKNGWRHKVIYIRGQVTKYTYDARGNSNNLSKRQYLNIGRAASIIAGRSISKIEKGRE